MCKSKAYMCALSKRSHKLHSVDDEMPVVTTCKMMVCSLNVFLETKPYSVVLLPQFTTQTISPMQTKDISQK